MTQQKQTHPYDDSSLQRRAPEIQGPGCDTR